MVETRSMRLQREFNEQFVKTAKPIILKKTSLFYKIWKYFF